MVFTGSVTIARFSGYSFNQVRNTLKSIKLLGINSKVIKCRIIPNRKISCSSSCNYADKKKLLFSTISDTQQPDTCTSAHAGEMKLASGVICFSIWSHLTGMSLSLMCFLVGAGKKKKVKPVRNVSECDALLFSPFFLFPVFQ